MAKDIFIDGLKPRSTKSSGLNSADISKNHFSPSRKNTEFGSKNITHSERKKIDKIAESTKLEKKIQKPKKSYARDVLGIDDEIDLDDFDIRKAKKEQKEKRKKAKKKKKLFIFRHKIISFIIFPIVLLLVVVFFWGDSIMMRITNGQSGLFDFIRTVVTGSANLKVGQDGRTNILIFGTSGYDMTGKNGSSVHDGAQLTDSIMILSLDQNSKDVAMISLPRDLKTDTCTATGKINEVYFCENRNNKNELGGAKKLREKIEKILGLEIQYYVHINWMSLIQIVDALGGITVTIDDDINDSWTKTYIKAHVPVTLNGEQALGLARARHGTAHGDFTRGDSQQKILIAIKDKIASTKLGIGDLVNLANILGDNLRSDLTSDAIYAGAKILSETEFDSFRQIPIIGSGSNYFTSGMIGGISYVYPSAGVGKYSNIQKYVKQALMRNPVVLENAQIAILNGSGVDGLEEKERLELEKSIFNIKTTGNAPSGQYFEKLYLYALTNKPTTKEKLETYYNVKSKTAEELPLGIDTNGIDFVIILGIGYSAD